MQSLGVPLVVVLLLNCSNVKLNLLDEDDGQPFLPGLF